MADRRKYMKTWTIEKEQYLINNYGKKTVGELKKYFNLSKGSITNVSGKAKSFITWMKTNLFLNIMSAIYLNRYLSVK